MRKEESREEIKRQMNIRTRSESSRALKGKKKRDSQQLDNINGSRRESAPNKY